MTAPMLPTSAPFAVGAVVKLASGGPAMTVSAIDPATGKVTCLWYDGSTLQTTPQLDPAVLKSADASVVQVTTMSARIP